MINVFYEFNYKINRNSYLLLAGDGPERNKVEQHVASIGLSDKVLFLGNVKDVRPLLTASDLTVIASNLIETFSIAMLESMSMATPVISTDIGGHREAINKENGALVGIGDNAGFLNAMEQLLEDRSRLKQMGANARRTVETKFSQYSMVKKTENVVVEAWQEGRRFRAQG